MRADHRAGIDHRHFAVTDDIGARSHIGEGRGIFRDDTADQRRNLVAGAIVKLDVAHIWNFYSHEAYRFSAEWTVPNVTAMPCRGCVSSPCGAVSGASGCPPAPCG